MKINRMCEIIGQRTGRHVTASHWSSRREIVIDFLLPHSKHQQHNKSATLGFSPKKIKSSNYTIFASVSCLTCPTLKITYMRAKKRELHEKKINRVETGGSHTRFFWCLVNLALFLRQIQFSLLLLAVSRALPSHYLAQSSSSEEKRQWWWIIWRSL